ncbi:MAG: hypothetical protein FJ303_19575 [Planctomycetes bacterium]|nr:hypothetical protein [Planctomycetota bacterium]
MMFLFRIPAIVAGLLCGAAFFATPDLASAQAKGLKIQNSTVARVEFAISNDPNLPPITWVGLAPGEMRKAFVVPDRQTFWFRFQRDPSSVRSFTVPMNPDPVYRWRFIGSLQCVGAPDIPMFPFLVPPHTMRD